MIANYHTHTRWCRHGLGEIEDVILYALKAGLKEIAVTEHVPHRDDLEPRRMRWDEFEPFDRELNEMILKYKGQIRVLKGFECENYEADYPDYRMFLEKYGYEFLILGQHRIGKHPYCGETDLFSGRRTEADLMLYTDTVCRGIESGLFRFLAHPDLILQFYNDDKWNDTAEKYMREIFSCCESFHAPVEINGNGYARKRRYPAREAWELSKDYDLSYLINSDAHEPRYIYDDSIRRLEEEVKAMGIRVEETIEI